MMRRTALTGPMRAALSRLPLPADEWHVTTLRAVRLALIRRGLVEVRGPTRAATVRLVGAACPECFDLTRTCEHRCLGCDRICPAGTCTNGLCESCCADRCDD